MILILSLNTSLDRTLILDDLTLGAVNRVHDERWISGGKGLNVLKMMNTLGTRAHTITVVGSLTGRIIQDLMAQEGITDDCSLVTIEDSSRICDVFVIPEAGASTVVNSLGPHITEDELASVTNLVRNKTQDAEYMVLTGSLPPGTPPEFYASLIENTQATKAHTVVDATGQSLTLAIAKRPWLVKVNLAEFMEIASDLTTAYGIPLADDPRTWYGPISPLCAALEKQGTNVVVTNGQDGSAAWTHDGYWIVASLPVRVRNAVGSGDAFLAGFVGTFAESQDYREALRCGTAAASSNAMNTFPEIQSRDAVRNLARSVTVGELVGVRE